jgi:hypothetical protein
MSNRKVYIELANGLRIINDRYMKQELKDSWEAYLADIIKNLLPSGSGFDSGCQLCWNDSTDSTIYINSAYHCRDEFGGYCGWIEFQVIISTPNSLLHEFELDFKIITGVNLWEEFQLNDYIADTFYHAITQTMPDDLHIGTYIVKDGTK